MINMEIKSGGLVEYGEFLQFIGIWFLIAKTQGPEWKDFWSLEPPPRCSGTPF
jgi:hypothetical protein